MHLKSTLFQLIINIYINLLIQYQKNENVELDTILFNWPLLPRQGCHTFLTDGADVVEHYGRIDTPAVHLAGDVQVFAGAAPCGTCDTDHIARTDHRAPDNKNLRQMAVTDGIPAMLQGHILAEVLSWPTLMTRPDIMAITSSPRACKSSPP